MTIQVFLMVFFAAGLLVTFTLYLLEKGQNRKMYYDFMLLKSDIDRKYISKKDARLLNAVQQAYENAKEKNKEFQMKEYGTLLKELEGKW